MNDYENVLKLIVYSLQMYINCFFFYRVLTPKYPFKLSYPISCLAMSVIIWITDRYQCIYQYNMLARQIIALVSFFIICRSLYRDSSAVILFFNFVSYVLMVVCDMAGVFFVNAFFPEIKSYTEFSLFGSLLWTALYLCVIGVVLILWNRKKEIHLPNKMHVAILLPLVQFEMIHGINYYNIIQRMPGADHRGLAVCTIGSALFIVSDIVLFQIILDKAQKEHMAAQIKFMNDQENREREYQNSVNYSMQEMRKIRHDFNNKLQTAYQVVLRDQKEGRKTAAQLLEQMNLQIEETAPVCYCENMIVNVILAEKVKEAEVQNILMDICVELSENITIEKIDLCSVFFNLLDNALHAATLAEKHRVITVHSWLRGGYCMVKVTNSVPSASIQAAANRDRELHGYGLSILESVAKKYQGEFSVCTESGKFIADIKLKVQA